MKDYTRSNLSPSERYDLFYKELLSEHGKSYRSYFREKMIAAIEEAEMYAYDRGYVDGNNDGSKAG
jgi:hypothetical protein